MKRRWCSFCFRKSYHALIERNYARRNIYECGFCKQRTVICRFCSNMARTGIKWDDECCAVHDGTDSCNTRVHVPSIPVPDIHVEVLPHFVRLGRFGHCRLLADLLEHQKHEQGVVQAWFEHFRPCSYSSYSNYL